MKLDRVIAVRNNKTIYRDGDRCIKVFNADYSKADVLNEALNQARIEETGLYIPKVLEVSVIEGKWTIVSEYIRGKTFAQLMTENPDKKEYYIEQMVSLHLSIHEKACPLLNRLRDVMSRRIAETPLSATGRYDLHVRLENMPRHSKVCHGDFNPTNIIMSEKGPCIIDWSQASQGNASADAARTYLLLRLNGDYTGAQIYLDGFCALSGVRREYVETWMPLVAAAQLTQANSYERAFLMPWINAE